MFILIGLLLPILGLQWTIVLGLVCAVLAYFYFSIKKKLSYWDKKGIKYVKPRFLLGNVKIFRGKSFTESTQDLYNAFPEERYHGIYQFTQPTLIIKDPDLIKLVTVKAFDHFTDHRDIIAEDLDPFWARNLLSINGERWRDMRSTLSPSFTGSKMRIMFELMNECAHQFLGFFKDQDQDTIELEMKDTITRYTNDVIATTAFGLKCDSLRHKTNEFYLMGKKATDFSGFVILKFLLFGVSPTLTRLLKLKIIPTDVAEYFSQIIMDTVKTRQEKNIVRPDMIHLLLEAQKGCELHDENPMVHDGFATVSESEILKNSRKKEITTDDIISQAFIFFLAGFDSVSTLLCFAFYELAVNPDIQDTLRKEIQNVPGNITYETLLGLKYLDMVVSETLRKWPSAALTDRKVTKPFTIEPEKPGEIPLSLEKNQLIWLPIYAVHNDPRNFPNPERFDPERFSDENKHKINPAVYMPFGAGPRNCIGSRFALLESKLLIFHILKNFQVVKTPKTPVPMVLDKRQISLAAKGGMWLGLKKFSN